MTDKKETKDNEGVDTVRVTDDRKVTWGFSQKRNLGNYESVEVSIYMTDHVPEEVEVTEFLHGKTERALNSLKSEIWGALGIEFEYNELGEPTLIKAPSRPIEPTPTPTPAPVAPVPAAPVPAAPAPAAPAPVAPVAGTLIGIYPETPAFCKDCAGVEFWDNRAQNDKKIGEGKKIGPDFKCKNKACEGGSGNGSPIYRDGSYDYNKAVGLAPVPAPTMAPPAPPAPPVPVQGEMVPSDEAPF